MADKTACSRVAHLDARMAVPMVIAMVAQLVSNWVASKAQHLAVQTEHCLAVRWAGHLAM